MKITAKELKEELDHGRVKLVDVRTPAEYGALHIEGSELMPLGSLRPDDLKDHDCVIICRSGKRAEMARSQLASAGCERLRVLEGGVLAWDAAGLPANRGAAVLSLERQVRIAVGMMVVVGIVLGEWVHPGFFGLAAFCGVGLVVAGFTDWCGMAMLLAKAPWNQRAGEVGNGKSCSV
ncbi:rhodanese-like domain-containing protein [Haloferula sp. A504]|uniref:rhodanese-like domain-containing protein n=1 Tax=Haloferula sp. A504 TaxID=3373601 RepID=UPI0031C8B171|nr:rhodanese-like domain-containing protein [Verrucomicrobiaceae bacterium E54]